MKKLYILIFSFLFILGYSQTYYSLLSNTNWRLKKINWDNNVEHLPPIPFSNSGSGSFSIVGETYVFNTKSFNTVFGTMVYGENNLNYFSILSTGQTLEVYDGENAKAVKDFDTLISLFYSEYQQGKYFLDYTSDNSGRHLVITNPSGKKLFYSAENLKTSEIVKHKISVYPNPASESITIENLQSDSSLELIDTSGKLVKSKFSNKTKTEINIKNLFSGIYYLKVDGKSVQKIIKR